MVYFPIRCLATASLVLAVSSSRAALAPASRNCSGGSTTRTRGRVRIVDLTSY